MSGADNDSESSLPTFRPFTREELAVIEKKIADKRAAAKKRAERRARNIAEFGDSARARKLYEQDSDDDEEDEELEPNPKLEAGNDIPRRFGDFPQEFVATPICDIDPYYSDKKTFIVISSGGTIYRFSAEKAMFLLSPYHPIRRIALYALTHPLFGMVIILTILINCYVMIQPETEHTASTEVIFTAIYTYESATKLLSRGFFLTPFTYLRDPWNWLDFGVIGMSYVTIAVDLGSFSALRTFRVFRALKSVAVIPGLKTIVSAIIYSVKNLRDVIILTIFILAVFALLGLQVYMGVLSQICIFDVPWEHHVNEIAANMTDDIWYSWVKNDSSWYVHPELGTHLICGNSSGAGNCPEGTHCLQGHGPNPNYGYTSFDDFGAAYLCAFRLMTQDFWENLYQITLRATGPYHILFFMCNILLGSFYLINLILAIVAMSYDELQRLAEEESLREVEELEAIREAEEAALAEAEAAAAEAAEAMEVYFGKDMDGGGSGSGSGSGDGGGDGGGDNIKESVNTDEGNMSDDGRGTGDISSGSGSNPRQQYRGKMIEVAPNGAGTIMGASAPPFHSSSANMSSTSRESTLSSSNKYAVHHHRHHRRLHHNNDVHRSMEAGVDNHGRHHRDRGHRHIDQQQSSSELDNHDGMSVRSATISGYRSEDSLALGGGSSTSGMVVGLRGGVGDGGGGSGRLGSLPSSPYVHQGGEGHGGGGGGGHHPHSRTSKSNSFSSHVRLHDKYANPKKPLVLFTYLDAQEHLPYADDSAAVTPKSELNGGIVVDTPTRMNLARKYSYSSHTGGKEGSYTSHTDLRYEKTKESALRKKMAAIFSSTSTTPPSCAGGADRLGGNRASTPSSILFEPMPYGEMQNSPRRTAGSGFGNLNGNNKDSIDINDVLVLNNIIDQVSDRPMSKATAFSAYLDDDEDEGPKVKDIVAEKVIEGINVGCVWDCCWLWIRISEFLSLIVFDPFTELTITLCIVVNVIFMALDHYLIEYNGMSPFFVSMLTNGNYFFTAIFAVESFVKLAAMSPRFFFAEGWNCFDFLIVALSLVELLAEGVKGLSMLRSFRLLRVFKLAKSWKSLNDILTIMANTLGALGNLTFVLIIIIFIFAVMGMQLFGPDYAAQVCAKWACVMPRWHFQDFMHSFMIVFRVLCGEWIESMWDCIYVAGPSCVPYFLATVLVGNLVILNLFLALLLSSFSDMGGNEKMEDDEPDKMAIAAQRIGRLKRFIIRVIKGFFCGIKGALCFIFRCGKARIRETDMDLDILADKEFQGENGDLKNRGVTESGGLKVEINHIGNLSGGAGDKAADFPDSSIGEGMDITIQGVNGHVKKHSNDDDDDSRRRSRGGDSGGSPKKPNVGAADAAAVDDGEPQDFCSDMSIGRGMDISICGDGDTGNKEGAMNDDDGGGGGGDGGGGSWKYNGVHKESSKEQLLDDGPDNQSDGGSGGSSGSSRSKGDDEDSISYDEASAGKNVEEALNDPFDDVVVEDCCPLVCYRVCPCCVGDNDSPFWQLWYKHRLQLSRLIENKYFETVVLALILISSAVMTLEDVWFDTRPFLVDTLYYLDRILTVVFFLETCLKLFAMGTVAYFGNAWCWLDFVIVAVSIINFCASLLGAGNIPIFKTMRTLRALRPLRAMAKMEGMKVVVNALVGALPAIFNVLLVCLIFWLIFAIIGVNTFMGKFYKCEDEETGERFSYEVIPNRTVCENETGAVWKNSLITFDNVAYAYLALLQIATWKGWTLIMDDAIDTVEIGQQPQYEVSINMYLYFVFFILFGSFFTLNLLVGVIIDKFNEQKNKGGSSLDAFMTEDQKKYIAAMKKASTKKPTKALPRPTWKPQAIVFAIVTNKKFDMIIMGFIGLNMLTMMCDHFDQSEAWTFVLDNLNLSFIVIFTAEMLLKMFALRHLYLADPWNFFDFIVVLLSLAGLFLSDLIEKYFVSPTLLRMVRVAKVGRVLRLIKGAKGIRTLLFSLIMAFPALVNICLLLFLVMFIFAVFGMSLFRNVKIRPGFDDVHNFQTFFKTFTLLFQICTSAGWAEAFTAITADYDCDSPNEEMGVKGNCGSFGAGVAFMIAYLVLSFLIIVNMYIAVILENYSQASEDVQEGITDEDYDLFYEIWQEFDPDGTQYMAYKSLTEFLDVLESPLQIAKPNKFKIIHMDIPIVRYTNAEGEVKENMVFCTDILDALTQDFFARKGNPIDEPPHVDEVAVTTHKDRPGYQRVSSTLWKQREDYCASLIQKAWKFHKLRNTESACTEEHLTGDEDDEAASSNSQQRGGQALRSPKSPVAAAEAAEAAAAPEMDPSGSGLPHPSRLPPVDSKHLIEVKCAVEEKSELKDLFEKDEEEKKKRKK